MKIGLAYDLKQALAAGHDGPDDALEEYDSVETVDAIAAALEKLGHEVARLGGGEAFLDNVRQQKVDIVFNIAEGRGNYRSREAQVPAVLEMLDIPYTGSDPLCLSVCLDKTLTKQLAADAGIATPRWLTVNDQKSLEQVYWDAFPFPAIVKPACEGSSKGVRLTSLVANADEAVAEAGRILDAYHQPVMIEEFIDGDEITVGIIGNTAPSIAGMMRILPKQKNGHFVYSLEVKRDYLNLVRYECPAQLSQPVLAALEASSLKAFHVLGCRDFARVDYRISADGTPCFIEINPLPGLGSYSDLIIMAGMLGRSQHEVIASVFEASLERYPQWASALR